MLREGRHVLPHPLAVMNVQDLGIRSQAIDVALLVFVLFHTPDPSRGLTEVRRVLYGAEPWASSRGERIQACQAWLFGMKNSTEKGPDRINETAASCSKV
jgi:hypothetical protein